MAFVIVGIALIQPEIINIAGIEIIGWVVRGVRFPAASAGTEFSLTPFDYECANFFFSRSVTGLPVDRSDLLRACC
jgi:hypothetical protein